jgi:23S rRNA (cytosine1962-C5)-methyltransferase
MKSRFRTPARHAPQDKHRKSGPDVSHSHPQAVSEKRTTPVVHDGIVVNRRAATRLRSGNPWVYKSDVVTADGIAPAAIAPVTDERGKSLGTALYSSASQIALRMISHQRVASDSDLLTLVRERVRAAIQYRDHVVQNTEAYRLIFSEADFLPGLIVDRYNDVLTVQVLTQAMDRADVREAVTAELIEKLSPASIVERVDPRIRELEQLPARESSVVYGDRAATSFRMNGLVFQFDAVAGQKTGSFLDQRENYVAAAQYARGDALDVFCYQGGFALHLARVCDQVSGVDSSRPALEAADQNTLANVDQLGGRDIQWIEANAFDLLRDYSDSGQHYDTIVLDPPAFAKSKKMLETAMRGYKELNLRALKMLRPGGVLVTCSCSYHVSEADFTQMLADASADAHRSVRIVERRTQAKDHPVLLALPESQYLKCVIAAVS